MRTLIVVEKTSTSKNRKPKKGAPTAVAASPPPAKGDAKEAEDTVSYYLSCHPPRRAEFFAELIRGHWGGCEIRNHWVRDAIFKEDATRSKNIHLNGNLAILRGALISLKGRLAPDKSWPFIHEASSMKPSIPFNMICKDLFK